MASVLVNYVATCWSLESGVVTLQCEFEQCNSQKWIVSEKPRLNDGEFQEHNSAWQIVL